MTSLVPEGARLEVKFEADEVRLHGTLLWLRMHRSRFREVHPERWVNNVYFDAPGYDAAAENFAGTSARRKVRLRWYGEGQDEIAGALELKCKQNRFGWKLRYPLKVPARRHGASWKEFRAAAAGQLPSEARYWLSISPQTVLLNRYQRRYYLSGDSRVRVTVDTGQAVWDQRCKPYMNLVNAVSPLRRLIVEFKFGRRDREVASNIIQGLPIRVSRYSKYVTGVDAIRF